MLGFEIIWMKFMWTNLEVNECLDAQECTEIAKTGGDWATKAPKF